MVFFGKHKVRVRMVFLVRTVLYWRISSVIFDVGRVRGDSVLLAIHVFINKTGSTSLGILTKFIDGIHFIISGKNSFPQAFISFCQTVKQYPPVFVHFD